MTSGSAPAASTTPPLEGSSRTLAPGAPRILLWLYAGRLILVGAIVVSTLGAREALSRWEVAAALGLAGGALAITLPSLWFTQLRRREPGVLFGYLQVMVDVVLVTTLIHVTGGSGSAFPPLYVLVIATGALLLPLPGGVVIGVLASLLYFADVVWGHAESVSPTVILQIALFSVVALVTGWLGDRVRRERLSRGAVETELRQLRLETDDILAGIGTGVMTVSPRGLLAYMNPAAEALLEIPPGSWQGRPAVEVLKGVPPGLVETIRGSMETRIPRSRAKVEGVRNGRPVTLGVSTTILEREEESAPSVTAIFQDITDQDRIEQLNRRAERLEALAELSASMAHEIKNPLASIRSAVEQLTRSDLDDEDRATLRRLVVVESDRVSRILSEFIEYSRLRMGEVLEVDLAEVARDTLALVRQHPDATGRRVRVTERIPPDGLRVPGDTDLLHRALFNLLLNAVQFAGEEGTVELVIETVERAPGDGRIPNPVRIAVRDSGPGVDPADVQRIFDPFFTTRKGGSGLGLAVVHRAVEAHQGIVLVESWKEGGGAEFAIYLPGHRADA